MYGVGASELLSNWDDFRLFGEAAKAGSFSKAAKRLSLTQPTMSRRVQNLEQRLGVRLFDRLPHGLVLTPEGEAVFEAVHRAECTFIEVQRRVLGFDGRYQGTVRISVADGTAAFWLSPRLEQLRNTYPDISVEFLCSLQPADVLNMECDLTVQFREPQKSDLVALKLGTLHAMPWVSPTYLERFGAPSSPSDLCRHRLLDHEAYRYLSPDYDDWVDLLRQTKQSGYLTNSSPSLMSAVQNGLGIAVLPTYLCENENGILPLDLGLRTRSGIWLTYHPSARRTARVRVVIDWIKSLFDHANWPWFSDHFQSPKFWA